MGQLTGSQRTPEHRASHVGGVACWQNCVKAICRETRALGFIH